MAIVKRQVIHIDEELCDGCGQCVPSCEEGAIQVIDGKARLVSDKYCDGLGACLGECPTGALSFEEREAEEFDVESVATHLAAIGRPAQPQAHAPFSINAGASHTGCPSAQTQQLRPKASNTQFSTGVKPTSELRQWPVKLYLVNPTAPYFANADILLAADCSGFAYGSVHQDFVKDKVVVIGCPKFDDYQHHVNKLSAIIAQNDIKSITVLRMTVPCCSGMSSIARQAVLNAGKDIAITEHIVSLQGEVDPA